MQKIQQQQIRPEFHPALCAVVFNRSFTGGRRTRGPVASPWRSRSYQDWKATASPVNLDGNFSNRTFTTNSLCFPQVHLTYLTLPWWHIVKDILETRESSMLTFWSLGTGWFLIVIFPLIHFCHIQVFILWRLCPLCFHFFQVVRLEEELLKTQLNIWTIIRKRL